MDEVKDLAKRYCNPTRVLKALRVRAKWRYEQVQSHANRSPDNVSHALDTSTDKTYNHSFALDKTCEEDYVVTVTAKCQWLGDDSIRTIRGCFIGFNKSNDLALIILMDLPSNNGEICKLPLLCSPTYLPQDIRDQGSTFVKSAEEMESYSRVKIEDTHIQQVEKESGVEQCMYVNGGLFQRQNALICDNDLINAFNGGLVLSKPRPGRKMNFRLAAKKDFWFQEEEREYTAVLTVRMPNNANEPINIVEGRDTSYHRKILEIARIAKFQLAVKDIYGMANLLNSIQQIGKLKPPSLYDKCLLFALCQRQEPQPLGRIIPCEVREKYANDGNNKKWTYGSAVCTCDLKSSNKKLMRQLKKRKRESGNAHDND